FRIISLATENNIVGTDEGMEVYAFYDKAIDTQQQADNIRDAIRDFPLYQGNLVAKDESATLIVVELLDETQAEQSYIDLVNAVDALERPDNLQRHIAGEGAISGYLGSYIDADAQRLNPIAAAIISAIVFIAFLRISPVLIGGVVIAAAVVLTLGTMAAFGIPFYVITNALPPILIGIAVADSIHIYNDYFERRALYPQQAINDAIVASMEAMWRPITLTTIAGFTGLYFAAYMPPFKFFGLFTALGVAVAWLYSLTFLPAAMSVLKTEAQPGLAKKMRAPGRDHFAKLMLQLGGFTQRFPNTIIILAAGIMALGLGAASRLTLNEDRITTFHPSEALYQADRAINRRFNGTHYLDIVIETPAVEDIFEPQVLEKMQALQRYAQTLDLVEGSTSIVDYLKQINRALNGGKPEDYRLPQDRDLIAQYFLLYSASASPTDFEQQVDYDYRLANIRVTLSSGAYADNKVVVEALADYIAREFNDDFVSATLSGRVNLNYHWINDLGRSHFSGMAIALLLVWLMSSLLFRSSIAGIFALLPVATSILLVYSTMVLLSIPLGIGTAMFAAVAIGLGVDFAIHTIDRLRSLYRQTGDMALTLQRFYPSTGRALLFNLLAIGLGFGVLITSQVLPLKHFGTIVAMSVTSSFVVSMTLLPALIQRLKPEFITGKPDKPQHEPSGSLPIKLLLGIGAIAVIAVLSLTNQASADELPEGRWVMQQVNAVDEGLQVTRTIAMTMIDRRGKTRERQTLSFRKYFGEDKRTVLFYVAPQNVKNTAFLTYDYAGTDKDDDQWLYLPALRKARRISASDRGDYFLGTDFSYEDIKNEGKVELADYHYTTLGRDIVDGNTLLHIEATPIDKKVAKALGYGKVHSWIDTANWMTVKAKYWDTQLNPLKTLTINDIRQVDGIWTRHQLAVDNHKTGHRTEFLFSDVDYRTAVDDRVFTRQALSRGLPQ
ncbi:MAG: outer membrane lipoprotein-sorting protein, partial [Pseudomonadota bacterium]